MTPTLQRFWRPAALALTLVTAWRTRTLAVARQYATGTSASFAQGPQSPRPSRHIAVSPVRDSTFLKTGLEVSKWPRATFIRCDFTGAAMRDMDLHDTIFVDCAFRDVNVRRRSTTSRT